MPPLALPPSERRPGELVTFASGRRARLDGFLRVARGGGRTLGVFVHGMGSNFYRSDMKKAILDAFPAAGLSVLSFNTRGAGQGTADERFGDCLADLDAALRFGREAGFRRFVLLGHSTGCQKIVHFQARRSPRDVTGLVLLAPADDTAICRRDLGPRYSRVVARAKALARTGRGRERIAGLHEPFSARRFLSLAERTRAEAAVFDYAGPMREFRSIHIPMLALFGAREEYAVIPVGRMLDRLRELHPPGRIRTEIVPGADHGFHGREKPTAARITDWILALDPMPGARNSKPEKGRKATL